MGWKFHRAHISILKAVVGLWSCYLQVLRLWRCYSWHLCIEAAIKRHTHTHTHIPFCSYFVLLLVDIAFSAQQVCILPFSHNSSSPFLLPDLVSVLDLVKKKRFCFKLPAENESYKHRIETQNVRAGEEKRKKGPWSTVQRNFKCWMTTCKNKIKHCHNGTGNKKQ